MPLNLTLATVGGSQDTWGQTTNTALTAVQDAINGSSGTVSPDLSALKINGATFTGTTADLNYAKDLRATGVTDTEFDLLDGAMAGAVVNNKAVVYDSSGGVVFGNWKITESGGVLYFATGGVNKMKLDASGNLTVTGNVTAYGSV
tara:strand:- start:544 stop:981 length:438 start_codon:yes stop_codon:yes gene_type:complete